LFAWNPSFLVSILKDNNRHAMPFQSKKYFAVNAIATIQQSTFPGFQGGVIFTRSDALSVQNVSNLKGKVQARCQGCQQIFL
jgi:hypothetical protein